MTRTALITGALLCKSGFGRSSHLPRTESSHGLGDWDAESGEAVQHGDLDVEFSDLPVEVARHEALTEQPDAMHLRLGAASAMVSTPSSPDRAAEAA